MSSELTRKDCDDLWHRTLTVRRPRQRYFVDVGMAGVRPACCRNGLLQPICGLRKGGGFGKAIIDPG